MFIAVLNVICLDPVQCFWQPANNYKQLLQGRLGVIPLVSTSMILVIWVMESSPTVHAKPQMWKSFPARELNPRSSAIAAAALTTELLSWDSYWGSLLSNQGWGWYDCTQSSGTQWLHTLLLTRKRCWVGWGGVDVYFSSAEKSEDITDTVLAVRSSLQDVGDALDDFLRGPEVLAVSPGLWNNTQFDPRACRAWETEKLFLRLISSPQDRMSVIEHSPYWGWAGTSFLTLEIFLITNVKTSAVQ